MPSLHIVTQAFSQKTPLQPTFEHVFATRPSSSSPKEAKFSLRAWKALTAVQQQCLGVLAHFRIPVTPQALYMQGLPEQIQEILQGLSEKNWVVRHPQSDMEGRKISFYELAEANKVLVLDQIPIERNFSHIQAGAYFQYIDQELDAPSLKALKEAFWHYVQARAMAKIEELGDVLCECFSRKQDFQEALKIGMVTEQLVKVHSRSRMLFNMGYAFRVNGSTDKALQYYLKSLDMDRKAGNRKAEAITLNNLGQLYCAMLAPKKALDYLGQSLAIQLEIPDEKAACVTLHNIAAIHQQQGRDAAYFQFEEEAYKLAHKLEEKFILFGVAQCLGAVLCRNGKVSSGLVYLEESLTLGKTLGHAGVAISERLICQYS